MCTESFKSPTGSPRYSTDSSACRRISEVGRRMKMRNRDRWAPTVLIWIFLSFYPLNAFADSPTVQIKSTVDRVIQILTNPQLQGEGKKQGRRKKLREAIFVRFDFQEMAQRSLGTHWQRRTPEEQTEFIKVSLATCWSKPMWIRSSLTITKNLSIRMSA